MRKGEKVGRVSLRMEERKVLEMWESLEKKIKKAMEK